MVDYFEKRANIIGSYYADQIKRLREAIKIKRRGKRLAVSSRLHSYLPDLAPSDFRFLESQDKDFFLRESWA